MMTGSTITASCLPDMAAEREHLAELLPDGVLAGGGTRQADCGVLAWARSGLMDLTGPETGSPLAPAVPVLARVSVLTGAIAELARRRGHRLALRPGHLLAGRAALSGYRRRGQISANGTCRLLAAADGWLAVNLARATDVASLPAVLQRQLTGDPFQELSAEAARRTAADLAARLQLLGVPAAVLASEAADPLGLRQLGEPGPSPRLVLDLSAMWAGPLCASILHRAGWRVLKVEDPRRLDGARSGPPQFYAQLHQGIPAVRLDLGSSSGRAELRRLAGEAGIIVESSRPRAVRRLGLVAEDWLQARPGRIWVSVTGYGRDDPSERVAFGDDAAVAGGLVSREASGTPVFCGDAIADPLTGLYAGTAALAAAAVGGGYLADVAMAGVCADLVRPAGGPVVSHPIEPVDGTWVVRHGESGQTVRSNE